MYKEKNFQLDLTQNSSKLLSNHSKRMPSSRVTQYSQFHPVEKNKTRFSHQLKNIKENIGNLANLVRQKNQITNQGIQQVLKSNKNLKDNLHPISYKQLKPPQTEQLVLPLTHKSQNQLYSVQTSFLYNENPAKSRSKMTKPFEQLMDREFSSPCFKNENNKNEHLEQSNLYFQNELSRISKVSQNPDKNSRTFRQFHRML